MSSTNVEMRNMIVAKEKSSDFIEECKNNEFLKDCHVARVLPSGNYYIYTFRIDYPEQKEELKRIQDYWI